MSVSRFRVVGTFDIGDLVGVDLLPAPRYDLLATVEIDRDTGVISVRPLRRHKAYALPLAHVAAMICNVIIRAEVREKQLAKKANKRRKKR